MENEILDYTKSDAETKRPLLITIICVLGILGAVGSLLVLLSDQAKEVGEWYPPFLAFTSTVGAICFIGFWKMKRWAVYLYVGLVLLNQFVMWTMGVWNLGALLIPLVFIVVVGSQLQKMD